MSAEPEAAAGAEASPPRGGVFASISQLLAILLDGVQTRTELMLLELQEAGRALLAILCWAAVGVIAATFGLLLAALTLIFAFWDTHRVLVAVLVTLAFFALALGAALTILIKLRTGRGLFAASLEEFAKDRQHFRPQA